MTLNGTVPVKTTTKNGPSDLLTVASKPGYATRCTQVKTVKAPLLVSAGRLGKRGRKDIGFGDVALVFKE